MKNNYEKVWDALVEYGVIDENKVYDDKSLLREIERNDAYGKVHYSLFEELLNTRRFREVVEKNLKVREYKKKDIVQDGETFVIPKTRQVVYYRKGRKISYYLAQKRRWSEKEINWMKENRVLPTKLMLYKYYQNFGEVRTVSSVMAKRYQLSGAKQGKKKKRILTKEATEVEEKNL